MSKEPFLRDCDQGEREVDEKVKKHNLGEKACFCPIFHQTQLNRDYLLKNSIAMIVFIKHHPPYDLYLAYIKL